MPGIGVGMEVESMSVWKKRIRRGMLTAVLVLACGVAAAALSYPFLTTTTDSVRFRKSASGTATVLDNRAVRRSRSRCWRRRASFTR